MGCEESADVKTKKSKFTFSYFDIYGRGEPGRMMLHHAKVQYVDDRIPMDMWPQLKNEKF